MSKRIQERKTREEPAVAKPRPTCLVPRNLLSVRQTSLLGSDASNVPGIRGWIQILFMGAPENRCRAEIKTQQQMLKSGSKTIRVKEAAGNRCKVLKTILKGRGCISTTCKSQVIYTLTKSSRTFDRNYVLGLMTLGTVIRHSECIYDDMEFHPFDEIYFMSRSSHQVGESTGTCLLRFVFLSGKVF